MFASFAPGDALPTPAQEAGAAGEGPSGGTRSVMSLAPSASRRRRARAPLAGVPYRWDPRREIDEINSRFGQLMQAFLGETPTLAGGISPLVAPIDVEE